MATKKRTTRKKSTRTRQAEMQSFRVAKDTIPFITLRLTRQTFYWILILAFIVVMQSWIIKLHTDVGNLTNALNETKLLK